MNISLPKYQEPPPWIPQALVYIVIYKYDFLIDRNLLTVLTCSRNYRILHEKTLYISTYPNLKYKVQNNSSIRS